MNLETSLSDKWRKTSSGCECAHSPTFSGNGSDNAFYSFVNSSGNELTAAVDHIRSIPLFYATINGDFYLSDSADWIAAQIPDRQSPVTDAEYRLTGYVTGQDTRHPDIKKLLPGERLSWTDDGLDVTQHFQFKYDHDGEKTPDDAEKVATNALQRLIDYADGRQIILPLSGGLDSRLIAGLLVKKGYDNLKAVTYGRPDSREARIARKRANALGIDWQLVEYDHQTWKGWYGSDSRRQLYEHNDNLAAIPHVEMGPALAELRSRSEIDADAVVVPGHTGDMLAGKHLSKSLYTRDHLSRSDIVDEIVEKHYRLDVMSDEIRVQLKHRLDEQLQCPTDLDATQACEALEAWDFRNRQAGFIVNSMRTIEAHDFDWYLPLWDRELTEFWLSVPLDQRIDTELYEEMVAQIWMDVTGEDISAATETERSSPLNRLKSIIRNSPLEPASRVVYEWLRSQRAYGSHPLAWYGLVPKDIFDEVYSGQEHINTFIAKEQLGEITLTTDQY